MRGIEYAPWLMLVGGLIAVAGAALLIGFLATAPAGKSDHAPRR